MAMGATALGDDAHDTGSQWETMDPEWAYVVASKVMAADIKVPTVQEAMADPLWRAACDAEMASQKAMKVGHLVPPSELPPGTLVVPAVWSFRAKSKADGTLEKYKARLNYGGHRVPKCMVGAVHSPVGRLDALRCMLALCAHHDWDLRQVDVKTAFLNSVLTEPKYMRQPPGYKQAGRENWLMKLCKAIYGMPEASREWNHTADAALVSMGYRRCTADSCLYLLFVNGVLVGMVYVHVNDFLASGPGSRDTFVAQLCKWFEVSDLGQASWILGMAVVRNRQQKTIKLHQEKYALEILKRHGFDSCRGSDTPYMTEVKYDRMSIALADDEVLDDVKQYQSVVGGLNYLACCARPDLARAVASISRYNARPGRIHWEAAVKVLRYLKAHSSEGIVFGGGPKDDGLLMGYGLQGQPDLHGYCDADHADDRSDRKSVSGNVFFLCGGPVVWRSCKQKCTALSSWESEYVAMCLAAQEVVWLRRLLSEMSDVVRGPTVVLADNLGAIATAGKSEEEHPQSRKHIDVRYHFVQNCVRQGELAFTWVKSEGNIADVFAKDLPVTVFRGHCKNLVQ